MMTKAMMVCFFVFMGLVSLVSAQTEGGASVKGTDQKANAGGAEVLIKKNLENHCAETFATTKKCPEPQCRKMCEGGLEYDGCRITCAAKDCIELTVEECPEDVCQVIKGCEDKDICYYKLKKEPEKCGELAYSGNLECCNNMKKKCGIEFYDGTCDMAPKNSVYSAPLCISCGNGYCNQFENKCNCPEDCSGQ